MKCHTKVVELALPFLKTYSSFKSIKYWRSCGILLPKFAKFSPPAVRMVRLGCYMDIIRDEVYFESCSQHLDGFCKLYE